MTYTEQLFLRSQRKRSFSLGRSVVGLFLPIRGTGATPKPEPVLRNWTLRSNAERKRVWQDKVNGGVV